MKDEEVGHLLHLNHLADEAFTNLSKVPGTGPEFWAAALGYWIASNRYWESVGHEEMSEATSREITRARIALAERRP